MLCKASHSRTAPTVLNFAHHSVLVTPTSQQSIHLSVTAQIRSAHFPVLPEMDAAICYVPLISSNIVADLMV